MNTKPAASASNKVIISCAITGAIHVPSLTPHLPITPSEITENAIGAAEAGAAVVHLHARDPEDGRPTPDPEVFARFLPEIGASSDVIINITTGGGHGMSLEERTAAARHFQPELCSLNMGSMNFGLFPMLGRVEGFRHEWEHDYLEMTRDFIFKNTFKDIESIVSDLGASGTRFEFECYDVGHLYNLAFLLEKGPIEPPLFVQTVFGILGGNVRVGLEDSIYLARGVLAESNAQQVEKITRILGELSLEIATPDEARQKLGLKGRDRTAIPT